MPINANVTNQQITASVSETQIDVSVGGGVGPSGSNGAAATVTVGTVTTGAPGTSASVVNAGTSSAAVLNFTIPAGAAGAAGATGPAGAAGATGATGPAGVVAATAPVTYDSGTQTVALSVGTGLATSSGSLVVSYGTTSGTACQGNDSRLSDARQPLSHTHTASQISDFTTAAAAAAPVQSVNGQTGAVTVASYSLPTATASVLGGVKIGSGISIDGNGVISASSGYTLPTATASVLGGVKIGAGVTITDGVISVATNYAAASHTHTASAITDFNSAAAAAAPVQSVAGRTGAVTLAKGDVGLGNVPNVDATARANHTGTQAVSTVDGLQAALDGKAAVGHTHNVTDITGLATIATSGSASDLLAGTVPTARLGTGTANSTTFLRGDNTWATVTSGSSSASDLTSGTLANARLTTRARASMNLYLWSSFR